MAVWRCDVSPRTGLPDPSGLATLKILRGFGLREVEQVRTARIYFFSASAGRAEVERVSGDLFADPVAEDARVWTEGKAIPGPRDASIVEVHLRPGVMDPVAASTVAALGEVGIQADWAATARRFEIRPRLERARLEQAAALLANDSIEEIEFDGRPARRRIEPGEADARIRRVALREADDAELARLSRAGHLFLSLAEMRAIRDEFRRSGHDPTDLELETLAQTWSEHCVHKTIRSEIVYRGAPMPRPDPAGQRVEGADEREIEKRYDNLLRDTIAAATRRLMEARRGPHCLSVFEDNAGVIAFDDEFGLAFKVETHNHPSAIEPYGGASTGLGGCIRDVLGCGLAAQPIACTDVFCLAPPDWPVDALPRGTIHPRQTLHGVVAGVRDYGNRMGIPTVNGAIHYDPRYLCNPLVFCGCVGLIPRDRIRKEPRDGDAIVLIGGRTGRDGIHGATFSSAELSGGHADEFAHAVQIGNAIEEKKILDVLLAARDWPDGNGGRRCLYTAITDCGAGGLSSAVGEMAGGIDPETPAETGSAPQSRMPFARRARGAVVELDRVPLKYHGLRYDEIWISEAQERMVLAVPPSNVDTFLRLCRDEDVEATVIGEFTTRGRLVVRFGGAEVGNLPLEFLHGGRPREVRQARWQPPVRSPAPHVPADPAGELLRRLAHPTVASKEWVVRQYDHEVQGRTVVKPLVGPLRDGPGDATVLRPRYDGPRGAAIGCGVCPGLSDSDPYWMAWAAIDEAVRNVVCVGGDPDRTAILDNFCWGGTDDPNLLGGLIRAAQGCHDAALAYGTPFISGKDSLHNEFALDGHDAARVRDALRERGVRLEGDRLSIPGTLLISALALVDDVSACITMDVKQPGGELWLLGRPMAWTERVEGPLPPFDPTTALRTHRLVSDLIRRELIVAAHDASDGGVLVAAAEMSLAGGVGLKVPHIAADLWQEQAAALYVVEPRRERLNEFRAAVAEFDARPLATLTDCGEDAAIILGADGPAVRLGDLRGAWQSHGGT